LLENGGFFFTQFAFESRAQLTNLQHANHKDPHDHPTTMVHKGHVFLQIANL
jgi:hypothetical protein